MCVVDFKYMVGSAINPHVGADVRAKRMLFLRYREISSGPGLRNGLNGFDTILQRGAITTRVVWRRVRVLLEALHSFVYYDGAS
jgi:hypothetical protein